MGFLGKQATSKYFPQNTGKPKLPLECYEKIAIKNDYLTLVPDAGSWKEVQK